MYVSPYERALLRSDIKHTVKLFCSCAMQGLTLTASGLQLAAQTLCSTTVTTQNYTYVCCCVLLLTRNR
jgi:hypothetical protein